MPHAETKIVNVTALSKAMIRDMYELYSRNYECTSEALFASDLQNKKYVLLLFSSNQKLKGFSTINIFPEKFSGNQALIIYSGDTIIDQDYWGKNSFSLAWLRFAGQLKSQSPKTPMYWFLIVKGHRTYRFLRTYSHVYYPAPEHPVPDDKKQFINYLASKYFGSSYNHERGIVQFPESRGHLRQELADVPSKDLHREEVQFFLQRNPGYRKGDELVCLCELSAHNLKPFARRVFEQGAMQDTQWSRSPIPIS